MRRPIDLLVVAVATCTVAATVLLGSACEDAPPPPAPDVPLASVPSPAMASAAAFLAALEAAEGFAATDPLDPAVLKREVEKARAADGVDRETLVDTLVLMAFGPDSGGRRRAVAALAVLAPERLGEEARTRIAAEDAAPRDAHAAQEWGWVVAWSLLFGAESAADALALGLELVAHEDATRAFVGHALLTLVTFRTVGPDPFRAPLPRPALATLDAATWSAALPAGADTEGPVLLAEAIRAAPGLATAEAAPPTGVTRHLHRLLARLNALEVVADLQERDADAAEIAAALPAYTFADVRAVYHPIVLF